MRLPLVFSTFLAGLVLAGCEPTTPTDGNAGLEQLRAQLTPAMQRAGVSDACIQSMSPSALAAVKSASSGVAPPRVNARNVGLGNPRVEERQRIQAIARKECADL